MEESGRKQYVYNSPCLQGACFLVGKDLSMEFDLEQETGCTCSKSMYLCTGYFGTVKIVRIKEILIFGGEGEGDRI